MGSNIAAGAIGAGAQGVMGLFQLGGGLFMKKPKRPDYQIADEFNKNISLAQGVKNIGMDKASYQNALNNIGRNQSAGIGALQQRNSIGSISTIIQRSNDAALNLDSMDARMKQNNFITGSRMEMGANESLANEKIQKMQWEKFQPYMDRVNQKNSLMGAGMQNIAGAAQSLSLTNPFKK